MKTMVDMKMSKADLKEDQAVLTSPQRDPYPYGLCLNIDSDELDKLGIKDLPEVGKEYHIMAIAKVTRVNASASEQDKEQRSISLQITSMCLGDEPMGTEEKQDTPKAERRERPARSVLTTAYGG